jgi:FtsZ-binding cell division protein ZapB
LAVEAMESFCSLSPDSRLKDLAKQRNELEAKVVDLANEKFKLKEAAQASDMYREGLARCQLDNQRLVNENKRLRETPFDRCMAILSATAALWGQNLNQSVDALAEKAVDAIIKTHGLQVDNTTYDAIKQKAFDWEKLASEYRFKADKLAEKNKDLEKFNEELLEENAKLQEEAEALDMEVEDLDGEAEQYFQEARKLQEEVKSLETEIKPLKKWCNRSFLLDKLAKISQQYMFFRKSFEEGKIKCNNLEKAVGGYRAKAEQLERENRALKTEQPGFELKELPINVTIAISDGKGTQFKETHKAYNLRNGDSVDINYTLNVK